MRRYAPAVLPLLAAASLAAADPIVLDGEFADWDGIAPVHVDPAGDQTGVFDLTSVWITSDSERVSFSIDVGTDAHNLQSGAYSSAQGLEFTIRFDGPSAKALNVVTLSHTLRTTTNGSTVLTTPGATGFLLLPTYASHRYEFSVPRSFAPDASAVRLESVRSDTLTTPYIPLSDAPGAPVVATIDRAAGTTFRLASINTLNDFNNNITGIQHVTRGPRHARLAAAVAADIYCFQEEYSTSAADIENFLESVDPLASAADWHAVKSGDTVVASHYPLILPAVADRARFTDAVAFVDLSSIGRGLVLVSSIHPACCGYVGNSNDNNRVAQHADMAIGIQNIAAGSSEGAAPGSSLAPVIVAGDWNLVGSRTPLTLLENVGLTAPALADLASPAVGATRRQNNEAPGDFFPGRLDLIAHDAARLARLNAFTLNTASLDAAALADLGLQASDSLASDHLMLVADFRFAAPADLDGNGFVGAPDLAILLAAWGQTDSPADLDANGVVGAGDLAILLAAWGS